jgi:hypothetical protein
VRTPSATCRLGPARGGPSCWRETRKDGWGISEMNSAGAEWLGLNRCGLGLRRIARCALDVARWTLRAGRFSEEGAMGDGRDPMSIHSTMALLHLRPFPSFPTVVGIGM